MKPGRIVLKYLFCIFLLGALALPGFTRAENAKDQAEQPIIEIRAGADNYYPPYEFVDDTGELTGFNVELLKAVARVTRMEIRFVSGPWKTIRAGLDSGELDVASGMFYSDGRVRRYNFSLPHSIVYHSLFVRKGSSIEKIEDLMGQNIVVIDGDIMHDYVVSLGFKKNIIVARDTEAAVKFIASGRYGAALLPKVQALHIMDRASVSNIVPAGPPLLPREYCFGVRKEHDAVLARLDHGLNTLKATGEYQKLKRKWFGIMDRERYGDFLAITGWILALFFFLLVLIWSWNRTLASRVREHTRDLSLTLAQLEKNEEQLRGVLESSSDAILALDRERRITRCNTAFVRKFGYSAKEVMGRSTRHIHPDNTTYEQFQTTVYPLVESEGGWQGEWQYKTRTGRLLDMETAVSIKRLPDGTPDGYVAVIRDITQRKKAEQERIRLATAIEQSADAILITDASGNILFMNAAAEKGSGRDRAALLGTPLEFPHTDTYSRIDFSQIIDWVGAGGVWHGKIVSQDDQGRQWEEEVAVSPVLDHGGETVNYVVVKRDITLLSRLENRLDRSRQMEAVGSLAGGIAHDFGNILVSLIGYAEMALEDDLDDDSPARHDVEQILTGCHRARELVEQILTFSRKSETPLEPIHLVPLIKEAVQFLKSALPDGVTLACGFNCAHDLVFETPAKIYQLMVNLVTNAAQALEKEGGHIEVLVSNPTDPQMHIPGWNRLVGNDILIIKVADNGPGMPQEVAERIFDPYFTTRDQSGGSGMGLSVVHGIVTGLEGTIDVETAPGKGSCFTIHLPLHRKGQEKLTDTPVPAPDHEAILLIDDEQDTLAVMRHSLIRLGYEVIAASSAKAAINILARDPNHFHLLFIDLGSTDSTGIKFAKNLARKASAICPELPVILCLGYGVMDAQPVEAGFNRVLRRPLSTGQIARAASEAISGAPKKTR